MEEYRLIELLRLSSAETPGSTLQCPDHEHIAEYFEGTLRDRDRSALNLHLVDCRHCLARLGLLERLVVEQDDQDIPAAALAGAKALGIPVPNSRKRTAFAWAAAAMLLIAFITPTMLGTGTRWYTTIPEPDETHGLQLPREVRSTAPATHKPNILSPNDGASIGADDLIIRWTSVPGSLYYDVRIVDEEGYIIRSQRVESATEWLPPASLLLRPGMSYYARVDAFLAEANSVSSDHTLFTIDGSPQ